MNTTNTNLTDLELDLAEELEMWDWARAAGVSADELRQALRAALPVFELREAA